MQAQKKLTNLFLTCGILSSLLYVLLLVFVPMLWEDYNSASQTVSELSAIGAPTRSIWVPPGIIWALLMAAFGLGVLESGYQNSRLRNTGRLILIYGIFNLGWPFVPMHLREVIAAGGATMTDTMHIIFASITVLLMLIVIGLGASAFKNIFRVYSMATIGVLFLFGLLTFFDASKVDANLPTPWIGVWERINIGVFLLWIVVLAVILLQEEKKLKQNF